MLTERAKLSCASDLTGPFLHCEASQAMCLWNENTTFCTVLLTKENNQNNARECKLLEEENVISHQVISFSEIS